MKTKMNGRKVVGGIWVVNKKGLNLGCVRVLVESLLILILLMYGNETRVCKEKEVEDKNGADG